MNLTVYLKNCGVRKFQFKFVLGDFSVNALFRKLHEQRRYNTLPTLLDLT